MLKALNVADIEGHTTHDPYGPLDQLPVVVKILLSKMPEIRQYLDKSPEKRYRAQNSQQITAFGWHRYNILNLINSLLNLKYSAVISELSKSNIFPMIIDLLFKFEHSSFCHSLVFKLASSMLDLFDPDAVEDFIQKTDLPKKILEAEKKFKSGSNITTRKEYMPFLYKLAEQVSQLFENITDFKKYIKGKESEWNTLMTYLSNQKKRLAASEIVADRKAPRGKVIVEDEEGFKPSEGELPSEPKVAAAGKTKVDEIMEDIVGDPNAAGDDPQNSNVMSAIDAILDGSFDDIVNDKIRLKDLTLDDLLT